MKKILAILTALLMLSAADGCNGSTDRNSSSAPTEASTPTEASAQTILTKIGVEGYGGAIAYSQDGSQPVIDPNHPVQSAFANTPAGTTLILSAAKDPGVTENIAFVKWQKDGVDFSEDAQITVTADADAEYTALFSSDDAETGFDMDKAIENTKLCDVPLSPGMTWGMLPDQFTIESEDTSYSEKRHALVCHLDCDGQRLGAISFRDCREFEDINEDTLINDLLVTNQDLEAFDLPKLSVYGVTLGDDRETLYAALGEPQQVYGADDSVKYIDAQGRVLHFAFTDDIITIITLALQIPAGSESE